MSTPRAVRALFLLCAALAGVAAQAAAPIEMRVAHDGEPLHLVLPADVPKDRKVREAIEIDAWDALGPLMRVTRQRPTSESMLESLRGWARGAGRVISNSSLQRDQNDGYAALRGALGDFRRGPRSAEQVAIWARAEFSPAVDVLVMRFALESRAKDDDTEDTEFTLDWRSAPAPGGTAIERGAHWAAADGAAFRAAIAAATLVLVELFQQGRRDALPAGGPMRGRAAGLAPKFSLVSRQDGRVLLLGDDDEYLSLPETQWTPQP